MKRAASAREQLLRYLRRRDNEHEAAAFLRHLQAAVGEQPSATVSDSVWSHLDDFVLKRISDVAADQYLALFKHRARRRRPLMS